MKKNFFGCILRITSKGNIILRKPFETFQEAFDYARDFKNCKIEIDGLRLSFEMEKNDNEFGDSKYDLVEKQNSLNHFDTITYDQFTEIISSKFWTPEAFFRYIYPSSSKYDCIGFIKVYAMSSD